MALWALLSSLSFSLSLPLPYLFPFVYPQPHLLAFFDKMEQGFSDARGKLRRLQITSERKYHPDQEDDRKFQRWRINRSVLRENSFESARRSIARETLEKFQFTWRREVSSLSCSVRGVSFRQVMQIDRLLSFSWLVECKILKELFNPLRANISSTYSINILLTIEFHNSLGYSSYKNTSWKITNAWFFLVLMFLCLP